ncbi:GLPGLI family protein [Elizabethkingia meningoseptica]|uniref:GLPGLI family protein n=1 Tax=Elizabethkingia meningoseptica TaxID=238 RepID=UPI0023AF13E8|nr:GLPGLI family protein [Elizabethkingia meningoseptica]MDE5436439.1 GLPGLI family protein [Elizabethkingia meningoseptica]MDE5508361.1 GLPGLI family protein [Elizabethkingia meningoseptica]MDE5515051.1 GLPGLI family protein [Elizabethkingia meningoseptica]MDE5525787.1 GLPGLI family protein [Elizabethkingia meningoseptica]MDE5529317.1 GLPGLI family protein [Elizabethkingia meningoseptica]
MKIKEQGYFLLFLFIYAIVAAQNSSIIYELTYKPSTQDVYTKKKTFFLDIIGNESVFRQDFRRNSDSLIHYRGTYGYGYNLNFNDQMYIKKNLKNNKIVKYAISPISKDIFYIPVTETLNWKLLPETQTIDNIKCQKAETDYGGRHWTAWFTQEIQIQEGPYVFHGLPGLIIEISDMNKDYIFRLAKITKFNHNSLFLLKGGKEINWNIFNKIQMDYYNDPYAFAKAYNMEVATDDGAGGIKKVDIRQDTFRIQEYIRKNDNIIELNKKIEYKP